ncbi:B12-binding domain-containing radical SAM protein [Hymenobacter perfusus]|uniref:Radical SAM protein n=1 Tax=Hymenobacter perfusus TaxID=1236770 RepID=A0A3R9NPU7_9BACT|nr:radical SAM protein [Hymenobacter perfusus]RSK38915.1 radical SAM protein [Hymenobacter perfusus]
MKLLLATSPHVRHAAVLQSDFKPLATVMYSFAPLGLLSLTAIVQERRPDISCALYDINRRVLSGALKLDNQFYRAAAEDICADQPDVIGFMTECDSYHHVLQIAMAIKEHAPKSKIVLGGPHASAVAELTLERYKAIDAIVLGEGELTFIDLLSALECDIQKSVLGALTRGADGDILKGGSRPLIAHLDDLPIPAYDHYQPDPGEEIFLEVGRGCPFKCEFCSTAPFWGRRHRVKSPARILKEIALLRELYGTTRVHFTHDLFTTDRKWVVAVCNALIDSGSPVRWTCSARTDTVDKPLLDLMSRAGCNAIYFGLESGSQRMLHEIRKDIPLQQSLDVLEVCLKAGITPNAGFIAGFPTEDRQSLMETFNAYEKALRLGSRPTHLFGYCPFVDSSMYARLNGLQCSGHFVDLPLGVETDRNNRVIIKSDPDLFGSYYRAILPDLMPGQEGVIDALDEFSPLVEAMLAPTLALADITGGMYEVYRAWLTWIHTRNDAEDAQSYRRGYGTPADFATFVLAELRKQPPVRSAAIAAAEAILVNMRVAEHVSTFESISIASYRSLILPTLESLPDILLGTSFSQGAILESIALDYDVTPALSGHSDLPANPEPTFLAWQIQDDGSIRLLQVDYCIYAVIKALKRGTMTAAELFVFQLDGNEDLMGIAPQKDVSTLIASLSNAAREGLIRVHHD